jgi:acyl-coenzyme A thioesterase PaaI-like protein
MAFVPANPDFERRTRESFAKQGAMTHIGATLEKVAPGHVEIFLPYRPELAQQHGFFHAGMLSAIAAADGERLHAVGEVIRSGRTLTVCRLEVFVEKQGIRTHCATGLQTLMCLVGRAGVSG